MARLPQPGSDQGQWGGILNEFLLEAHTTGGTLKPSIVGTNQIADGAVTNPKLADSSVTAVKLATTSSPTNGQVLAYGASGLGWTTLSGSGSVPDASTVDKGLIQLAGDLAGTAALPTVPGLAGKEPTITAGTTAQYYRGDKSWRALDKTAVGLANVDNTTDAAKPISSATQTALNAKADGSALTSGLAGKANTSHTHAIADVTNLQTSLDAKASTSALAAKADDSAAVHKTTDETITGIKNFTGTLQAGGQTVVATNDARLTNQRTPSDGSVTTAKIVDDAITEAKLSAANTPTNSQLLSYNGTNFTWVNAPVGGADPVMGGDISGNASSAQIVAAAVGATELASNAVTTVKILDANVTTAKIADANITTAKILDSNVTTAKLADNAVTTAKITDANVTGVKIADNTITEPKLAISNTPSNNQVLSWNGSTLAWATPATGGGGGRTVTNVKTAAYTAVADEYVIVNSTAGGFNVTLPASPAGGTMVSLKSISTNSNAVLVLPGAGATIEDSGNYSGVSVSLNSGQTCMDFLYDGTSRWYRVG